MDWPPGPSHAFQMDGIVHQNVQNDAFRSINGNQVAQVPANNDIMQLNVDNTFEYLTGIFPNADPSYLRGYATILKNENDVRNFVEIKLQSDDYPKAKKMKVSEEQELYKNKFNVEQFLILFPDPFKHFEDETRKCVASDFALEFLKNEFRRVRVNTIVKVYKNNKYNMSIAAKNLRLSTDFIQTPRRPYHINWIANLTEIPLLQEMAFVHNHAEILKHFVADKQKVEEEYNSLKTAGALWTCECCYDDECVPSNCSTCSNAHVFCNSCIVKGTDAKLGDGETTVPCFLNCGSEFTMSTLQKVLPPTKFSILSKKRQSVEVMAAGLPGLVSCPFCVFASIPDEGDKIFKCLNPECMKESCIECKEPSHVPFKCGEVAKTDKARKYIEEKMTQALMRTCYQCKRGFYKEEGCNKMTCPCGAMMCYICNKPVKDYKHFRGQGCDELDKCPLWSDDQRLNAEIVRKVEEAARMEVLRQDPTLNIGTTSLAPALPPPTPGPHSDIPETQNIADILAARVLNQDRFNSQEEINRKRKMDD